MWEYWASVRIYEKIVKMKRKLLIKGWKAKKKRTKETINQETWAAILNW